MIELPIKGGNWKPESWEYQEWERVYGEKGVNVELEMKKARQWLLANPRRRPKTGKRYMVNWLNRAEATGPERDVVGASSSYRNRVERDFLQRQKEAKPCNERIAQEELAKVKKLLGMRA